MSDIVLSSSVRQNLLSLQSTADLLSTTQNRLATGKKVNTALDNPTNYFTAASLDSRASDINNLLDGIGNGVQVLQAANTGISSLQKLIDSAKSVANQALQTQVGFSTKSEASATITGAAADNLLGGTTSTTQASNAKLTSTVDLSGGLADPTTDITFTVNSKTVTLTTGTGTGTGGNFSLADIEGAINGTTGVGVNATDDGSGHLVLTSTGTAGAADTIATTGTAAILGATPTSTPGADASTTTTGGLSGLELTIAATDGGTALDITFGNGGAFNSSSSTGVATNVSTLDQLNTVLASNNLTASLDTSGKITLTTTNDHASAKIGVLGGSATGAGLFTAGAGSDPIKDANAQNTRNSLIAQYNTIITQIDTTSQDSSFNGINLLNGDQLKLTFNETGKSTLNITGVNFNSAGLGLSALNPGTDFQDNAATNKVLTSLNDASSTLRSQASALGSNLSIVQIRQDFSKNLINVLQTGSSNLTLADTNEEAANSQALSTRQSIAVSALALANQSQQSVLQLLR